MRQYFLHLRLYRQQEQDYYTFGLKLQAESLGDAERQLTAFESGLRVAGALRLNLENIGIDINPGTHTYLSVGDPALLLELQYFLGLKRDRRHKEPPKVETPDE